VWSKQQVDRALHHGRPRAAEGGSNEVATVRTMKTRACFIGILLVTATLRAGAREVMTLSVSPAVAFAPATLIVRAKIEADARNRTVEIVAESPSFYRSSEIQLDGDKAPRTNMFEFRGVPSGTYDVKATLRDASGQARASVRSTAKIIATGGSDR
jgi:hypothetical protein